MQNKKDNRYYYNGITIHNMDSAESTAVPCSPELIQQLGTEPREVVEGKDFELKREIYSNGGWRTISDDILFTCFRNDDGKSKRITAIPLTALKEKAEEESAIEEIRRGLMNRLCYSSGAHRGEINPSYACNYLASLEYRITQLEKTQQS